MASDDKVYLSRLSYVIYEHPDVSKFEQFAEDFGLEPAGKSNSGDTFFRGYGLDPYIYTAQQAPPGQARAFHGAGFVAKTVEDFNRACKMDGARVIDISDRPGGGKMVSVPDPNGYAIQVLYGQEERKTPSHGISNVIDGQPNVNMALEKPRKGVFNRLGNGPAKIHKLGHFGYATDNHTKSCAWYSEHFNFKATDILHKPDDPSAEILAFYHLDLGAEYSDHHCLLLAIHHDADKSGTIIHHSSFEVEDFDTQMMGHEWLRQKGYRPMWGVGRHVMGSQIFDYWYDSSDFIIEHYTDSDVVTQDTPTCRSAGTPAAIWGPAMPKKWE